MSIAEARRELQRVAGSQLDPSCVGALLAVIESGNITRPLPTPEPAPASTTAKPSDPHKLPCYI